ncbi:DEAD/DEAH box helicase [Vibrio owensii]|uniref:DEAD/DEAH box helicase n=1 Tax=Vibrio owensii TaxID=696485 RepID=UPI0022DE4A87|nr:DEAD/DEAH box helicase [Vibrio owensii]MDA0382939.1 DEAD/DEAH box helicase [Vibrio owensii]
MKFENQSLKLLSITKSKATMYELGLDEQHHHRLEKSPSTLLIMTIGILGDLCREELATARSEWVYEQRQSELRNVAKYFDALIESKLQSSHNYYLNLLAAASYYLAHMPGSASVLSKRLGSCREKLTDSGVEFLLECVLRIDEKNDVVLYNGPEFHAESLKDYRLILDGELFLNIVTNMHRFLRNPNEDPDAGTKLVKLINDLQQHFINEGSDREILIAQVVAAVIQRMMSNSVKTLLPQYTELKWEYWSEAFRKRTFVKEIWPAQRLLGEAGVFTGKSAVIQLPTSAGKTKSAELILRSAFLSGRASVSVIVAPFRSLCREVSASLSEAFVDENITVNQLSDVLQIDRFDTELFSQLFTNESSPSKQSTVIVATPEKLVYLLRHLPGLCKKIALVIYDEGHQFDSGVRGVTYELLLTSLKRQLNHKTQHVLISAVLSNSKSINDWLCAGDGTVVNGLESLSSERKIAFTSWKDEFGQLHYMEPSNINEEQFSVPRLLESHEYIHRRTRVTKKTFPSRKDKTLVAAYLGIKLSEHAPVAVFCGQKRSVMRICREIVEPLENIEQLRAPIEYSDKDEIYKIARLAKLHFGEDSFVAKAIEQGVLPHSANMPNGVRLSVEYAMELGYGRCVICTSTLAQGVNLPIKYLVVSGVFQGDKLISTRDFHNLLGRAGRSGKHTEGTIIFADSELYDCKRIHKRKSWTQMNNLLAHAQSEHCLSSLLTLVQPYIGAGFELDPIDQIKAPFRTKIRCIQLAKREGYDITRLLTQVKQRDGYIKSIESYLLAHLTDCELINEKAVVDLCKETFAYSIANEPERKNLLYIFMLIAERVQKVEASKRPCFGKALLGIKDLEVIEGWLLKNISSIPRDVDSLEMLLLLWPMLKKFNLNNKLGKLCGRDAALSLSLLWCEGKTYAEILKECLNKGFLCNSGRLDKPLNISSIIEICDSALGYDTMLIVGACADLIETLFDDPLLAKCVRDLQLSLRIGLSDNIAKELYSIGLADREVALAASRRIAQSNKPVPEYGNVIVEVFRNEIKEVLQEFPSVFMDTLYGKK